MHSSIVLTIVAADRPGLVESLSSTIAEHHGNWLKSRMTTLAGQFAGILWVMVPSENLGALQDALHQLESDQLSIVIHAADPSTPQPLRTLDVELVGHDRPGIVRELATALKQRQINVEELASESYSAPMSGEPLFKATLQLGLAPDTDLDELEHLLEDLANQLALDLTTGQPQTTN